MSNKRKIIKLQDPQHLIDYIAILEARIQKLRDALESCECRCWLDKTDRKQYKEFACKRCKVLEALQQDDEAGK